MGQRDGSMGLETYKYVHRNSAGEPFSIVRSGVNDWLIFKGDKGDAGADTGHGDKTLTKCRQIISGW